VREAREMAAANSPVAHPILERAGGDCVVITGPLITAAAQDGDPAARELFEEIGQWLGVGIANLAAAFDPGRSSSGAPVGGRRPAHRPRLATRSAAASPAAGSGRRRGWCRRSWATRPGWWARPTWPGRSLAGSAGPGPGRGTDGLATPAPVTAPVTAVASQRMSNVDAAWLGMDSPDNLMMVTAVLRLDRPVDRERLRDVLARRLVERYPKFRLRPLPSGRRSSSRSGPTTRTSPWTGTWSTQTRSLMTTGSRQS
jgi:hypothetical protein